MNIKFKTKQNPIKGNNKQNMGIQIIFFSLNFLLVPFSAIATYKGYSGFLDSYLAIVLAIATGLLFFGLNVLIKQYREDGKSHIKQTLGFLLPLLISFFGNFTYFYGNQMEGTTLQEELTNRSVTLNETYQSAVSGLNNTTGLENLKVKLDGKLGLLKNQMQTPPTGYGPEAQKIWASIIKLFDDYNREYNNATSTQLTKVYVQKYSNFENLAYEYYTALKKAKETEVNSKIKELDDLYVPANDRAVTLLKAGNEDQLKTEGLDAIKQMRVANNAIGEKTKGFLNNYSYNTLSNYEGVSAKSIKSVLESAFIKLENVSAMAFGIVISLVIDLAILIFIYLSIPYNKKKGGHNFGLAKKI